MKDGPGLDLTEQELLAAHVAGDLEPAQDRRAEQMLAASAEARALVLRLRTLDQATSRWGQRSLLPAEVRDRVGAALEGQARGRRRQRRLLWGAGLAAAAAGLTVLVAVPFRSGQESAGDAQVVRTGAGQYRLLEIGQRAVAFVGENAELELRRTSPPIFIREGSVRLVVKTMKTSPFLVGSPAGEVAVLGTELDVTVQAAITEVRVTRGEVEVRNAHGRRRVWAGEVARVRADQSPRYVERLKGIVVDLAPDIEEHPASASGLAD